MTDYPEPVASEDSLAKIARLAEEQRKAAQAVADAEAALKARKEEMVQISERDLPEAMLAVGMSEVKLQDGTTVTVADKIHARITKANEAAAFKWLEDNGEAGLIKSEFKIGFGRDRQDWASGFQQTLDADNIAYTRKQSVNHQTLGAFVREKLEDGVEIPEEVFGVFRQTKAKLT
tara:strand:- start:559 stop:1086 length:528 start_codon:yes stop_codon:yes gene_type:complete